MDWILVCSAPDWRIFSIKRITGSLPPYTKAKLEIDTYLPISFLGDLLGAEYYVAFVNQLMGVGGHLVDVYGQGWGTIVLVLETGPSNIVLDTLRTMISNTVAIILGIAIKEIRLYAEKVVQEPPSNGNGEGEDWWEKYWLWLVAGGIIVFALLMRRR